MYEVTEEFEVGSPIERVFAAISDIGEFGYALAGVKHVEIISPSLSRWKVEVKAGIMARTLVLDGRITERVEPKGIAFEGEGPNISVAGSIWLEAVDANTTRCKAHARSEVTGRLAPLINLVVKTTQKQLIAQTIINFRNRLAAVQGIVS